MQFLQKCWSHDRPPCSLESRPLQIHFSIWPHGSTTTNKWNCRKILRHQKKFTDFEHFSVFEPRVMKTMFTMNWPNYPGTRINLDGGTALRIISLPYGGRERAANGPRQGRKNIRKCLETINPNKIFLFWGPAKMRFFENFQSHDVMAPKLVHIHLRRCAFISRYDTTNRKQL